MYEVLRAITFILVVVPGLIMSSNKTSFLNQNQFVAIVVVVNVVVVTVVFLPLGHVHW
jgi:hypothetical protein